MSGLTPATIEVGGANKTRQQIADVENAYGLEVGYGGKIPLWMFGLLY